MFCRNALAAKISRVAFFKEKKFNGYWFDCSSIQSAVSVPRVRFLEIPLLSPKR